MSLRDLIFLYFLMLHVKDIDTENNKTVNNNFLNNFTKGSKSQRLSEVFGKDRLFFWETILCGIEYYNFVGNLDLLLP